MSRCLPLPAGNGVEKIDRGQFCYNRGDLDMRRTEDRRRVSIFMMQSKTETSSGCLFNAGHSADHHIHHGGSKQPVVSHAAQGRRRLGKLPGLWKSGPGTQNGHGKPAGAQACRDRPPGGQPNRRSRAREEEKVEAWLKSQEQQGSKESESLLPTAKDSTSMDSCFKRSITFK